jgi:transposase-like protein
MASHRHTPQEKLDIVLRSYAATNIAAFSKECSVDRTTLYAWRRELVQAAVATWESQRPGRPSAAKRETIESLRKALCDLAERHRALEKEVGDLRVWSDAAKRLVAVDNRAAGLSRLFLGGPEP